MRRYDDPVEVRTGDGQRSDLTPGSPEQFLWRGQLWQVRGVLAHWVETSEWWRTATARAVAGTDEHQHERQQERSAVAHAGGAPRSADARWDELLGEREIWRVEARRPVPVPVPVRDAGAALGAGVFELARDATAGRWQLLGCTD